MPTTKWDGTQMPSQHGCVAIVRGANQGIGFECARQLAEHGAHVVLACRSEARARGAAHKIRTELLTVAKPGQVEYMLVDVGSLESVRAFATAFRAKFDRLDILIHNAGVAAPVEKRSADGLSIQFGVNYLGHFYMTTLLFDLLKNSTDARVIPVSSVAHRLEVTRVMCQPTKLDFTVVHKPESDKDWSRYEKSKLLCLIFAYELVRRLHKAGITNVKAAAAHPGVCYTNIFDEATATYFPSPVVSSVNSFYSMWMQDTVMGSLPILYAATETDVKSGDYWGPDKYMNWVGYPTRQTSSDASYSEDHALDLWALSEQLTKTPFHVA